MECITGIQYTDWIFILETSNLHIRPAKKLVGQVPQRLLETVSSVEMIEEERGFHELPFVGNDIPSFAYTVFSL